MHLPPRIHIPATITPMQPGHPQGFPAVGMSTPAMIQPLGPQGYHGQDLAIVHGPQPPPRYVMSMPPAFEPVVGAPPMTLGGPRPAPKALCALCHNPGGRRRRKGGHAGSVVCDTCNKPGPTSRSRATHFEPMPEGIFFADIEWPTEDRSALPPGRTGTTGAFLSKDDLAQWSQKHPEHREKWEAAQEALDAFTSIFGGQIHSAGIGARGNSLVIWAEGDGSRKLPSTWRGFRVEDRTAAATTSGPAKQPDPADARTFVLHAIHGPTVSAAATMLVALKAAQELRAPAAAMNAAGGLFAKARNLMQAGNPVGASPLIVQAFAALYQWAAANRALDALLDRTRNLMVEFAEVALQNVNTTSGPGTTGGCGSGLDRCSEVTVPSSGWNYTWKAFMQFGYKPEQLIVYSENPGSVTVHAPVGAGNWGGLLDALTGASIDWMQPRCTVDCAPPAGARPVEVSRDFNQVFSGIDARTITGAPTSVGLGGSFGSSGAFAAPTGRGNWPPRPVPAQYTY